MTLKTRKRPRDEASSSSSSSTRKDMSFPDQKNICQWKDDEQSAAQTSIRSFFVPYQKKVSLPTVSPSASPRLSDENDDDDDENDTTSGNDKSNDDKGGKVGKKNIPLAPIFASACTAATTANKNATATATTTSNDRQQQQTQSQSRGEKNKTNQKKKKTSTPLSLTQVFLDCGQKSWGQVLCKQCNMLYVPGVKEDIKAHEQMCLPIRQGVPWRISKTIVQKISNDECIVRTPPTRNNKAPPASYVRLLEIVTNELGMNMNDILVQSSEHTTSGVDDASIHNARPCKYGMGYLYIRRGRVMGLVLVEHLSCKKSNQTAAVLGVAVLWVHAKARSQGIATQLVDVARMHSIFGLTVAKPQIAFSSPTQAGLGFARAYCNSGCGGDVASTAVVVAPNIYDYHQTSSSSMTTTSYPQESKGTSKEGNNADNSPS